MKRRILLVAFAAVVALGMFPAIAMAATNSNAVSFYVDKNVDAGLDGKVTIEFSQSSGSYSGNLYLPGSADTSKLSLSWTPSDSVTVKVNGTTVTSGSAAIPEKEGSLTYSVTAGGSTTNYTIKTKKGSSSVAGMFLDIDESYVDDKGTHTIDDMNTDTIHETSCYGGVSFESKTYDMSIKGRGNWTWHSGGFFCDKKPYNITIYKDENAKKGIAKYDKKKNVEFIEGIEAKKWTLLANYADSSLMRNKIGYDLAVKLGIGLESRYVDVWMNGEYIGNYLMTPKSDYNTSDDGYLLELDNNLDLEDPYFKLNGLDPVGSSDNVITVKDVGDAAADAGNDAAEIQKWMQAALDAVMKFDSDEYLKYIDVDSWAKLYLLQEYCKNHDIVCGSILMHRDGTSDSDKLIAGPVWDLDNAWGRVFYNSKLGTSESEQLSAQGWYIDSIGDYNGEKITSFLQYLGKHDDFMQRVYQIFNEYKSEFEGAITEIDSLHVEIADSADMNFSVWNVDQSQYNASRYTWDTTRGSGDYTYKQVATKTWDNCVSNLKAYVSTRYKYMSDYLATSAPTVGTISGETTYDVLTTLTLTIGDTADAYQWQSSVDGGKTWTNISGATSTTYTDTVKMPMNGMSIRCLAIHKGKTISTNYVAKTTTGAAAASEPVTLTVNLGSHQHSYSDEVIAATCVRDGYTIHRCACGDVVTDAVVASSGHKYEHGKCTECGNSDPDYEAPCKADVATSLVEGTLSMSLGGKSAGQFTFTKSGSNWTIQSSSGQYLSIGSSGWSNSFQYSTQPYAWTFSDNKFSTSVSSYGSKTTYYLIYESGNIKITTTNSSSATATFTKHVENYEHSFSSKWSKGANHTHTNTCKVCGTVVTEDCEGHYVDDVCSVCGQEAPRATATFVTGDGASAAPKAQTVVIGKGKVTKPATDPTKVGYIFSGWYASGEETEFVFGETLSSDVTIEARWVECTSHDWGSDDICKKCGKRAVRVTATFSTGEGASAAPKSQSVISGEGLIVRPDDPTRVGYTFLGWYASGSESAFDFSTPISADVTIEAKWDDCAHDWGTDDVCKKCSAHQVSATFVIGEGATGPSGAYDAQKVVSGKGTLVEPTAPTRIGYIFAGWTSGGTAFDFTKTISSNVTIKAEWTECTSHEWGTDGVCKKCGVTAAIVTFVTGEGASEAPETQYVIPNEDAVVEPDAPTKVGYIFGGWYANGQVTAFEFGKTIASGVTLTAKWTECTSHDWGDDDICDHCGEKRVTATFDIGEGATGPSGAYDAQKVIVGKGKVTKPATDPTKVGYIFAGWVSGDASFDFDKTISADVTISAKWTKCSNHEWGDDDICDKCAAKRVTATFDIGEGATGPSSAYKAQKVVAGEGLVVKPSTDPKRVGYTFAGWFAKNEIWAFDFTKPISADVTIKAAWAECVNHKWGNDDTCDYCGAERVTATFVIGEGATGPSGAYDAQDVVAGKDLVREPDAPTKIGYIFAGWTSGGTAFDFYKTISKDVTITASWTKCESHEWGDDDTCDKCGIKRVTATFVIGDGATGPSGAYDAQKVVSGEGKVTKPATDPSKVGYIFKGWTSGGSAFDFTKTISADVTITASWDECTSHTWGKDGKCSKCGIASATATFVTGDGASAAPASQTVAVGKGKVTKPATDPTKVGYIFKGWTSGGSAFDFTKAISADVTITASWDECTSHEWKSGKCSKCGISSATATFVTGDGASAAPASQTVAAGKGKVTKPATNPTKVGFIFDGWYASGEETEFDFTNAISANVTISAKWTKCESHEWGDDDTCDKCGVKRVTATFVIGDGATGPSGAYDDQKVVSGEGKVTKPATDPTKIGYIFKGWTSGGSAFDFSKAISADVTITASWDECTSHEWSSGKCSKCGIESVTATFVTGEGASTAPAPQVVGKGKDLVARPENPTRVGYTFLGWYASGKSTAFDFSAPISADVTIEAKWDDCDHVWGGDNVCAKCGDHCATATFVIGEGATGPSGAYDAQKVVANKGILAEPAAPTRAGYTFVGWFASGEETEFDFTVPLASDVTIVAAWDKNSSLATAPIDISIIGQTLSPAYDSKVLDYNVALPAGTASVRISIAPSDDDCPVKVSVGKNSYSYTGNKIDVNVSNGDVIKIICGDEKDPYYYSTNTYQINVSISANNFKRLYGYDRYKTGAKIADTYGAKGGTVILATGDSFPDALCASALAGAEEAPILMTSSKELSQATKNQLNAIKPTKIIVVGGAKAVPESVLEAACNAAGIDYSDEGAHPRYAGDNRFATGLTIYQESGLQSDTCIIATGYNFADALSISPYAYASGTPIFLTGKNGKLDSDTVDAIFCEFENVIIVGGDKVVSDAVVDQIGAKNYVRLSGSDRYSTSIAIANWEMGLDSSKAFKPSDENVLGLSNLAVATGSSFPDALTGGALCGKNNSVLLLMTDNSKTAISTIITPNKAKIDQGYIFGGPNAISDSLENALNKAVK